MSKPVVGAATSLAGKVNLHKAIIQPPRLIATHEQELVTRHWCFALGAAQGSAFAIDQTDIIALIPDAGVPVALVLVDLAFVRDLKLDGALASGRMLSSGLRMDAGGRVAVGLDLAFARDLDGTLPLGRLAVFGLLFVDGDVIVGLGVVVPFALDLDGVLAFEQMNTFGLPITVAVGLDVRFALDGGLALVGVCDILLPTVVSMPLMEDQAEAGKGHVRTFFCSTTPTPR